MLEALITAIISALTTVMAAILPVIAANTGKNALQKDMTLYRQWRNIVENRDESYLFLARIAHPARKASLCEKRPNAELDPITEEALTEFRHSIDLKLIIYSRNVGRYRIVFIVALVILLIAYITSQVTMHDDNITDDFLRSIIYIAAVLITIGLFVLWSFHKVGVESRRRNGAMLKYPESAPLSDSSSDSGKAIS